MKKINNKGMTLVELIVSFMLVSVAMLYFFQTLYTVSKIYTSATKETNEFVDKDYALRLLDKYVDKGYDLSSFCTNFKVCDHLELSVDAENSILKYILYADNSGNILTTLYKPFTPYMEGNSKNADGTDYTDASGNTVKAGYWWNYFPGYSGLTGKKNDMQVSYIGESFYKLGPFKGALEEFKISNGVDCSTGIADNDGYTYIYIRNEGNMTIDELKTVSPTFFKDNVSVVWKTNTYSWNTDKNYKDNWYLYVRLTHNNASGCTSHVALDSITIN